jgi:integrase
VAEPVRTITVYPRPRLVAVQTTAINEQMLFRDAAPRWLESRRAYISERTASDYRYYIRRLNDFFGSIALENIDGEHMRQYKQLRTAAGCGPSVINHECLMIQGILKRVGRWAYVANDYEPLPTTKESPGRCIESWEEERYLRVGAANPAWQVAYVVTKIMARTGICPGELRHVRLKDVGEERRVVRIVFAKNVHRERWVPLANDAWDAFKELLQRAQRLGSTDPDHYLLPFRVKTGRYDPPSQPHTASCAPLTSQSARWPTLSCGRTTGATLQPLVCWKTPM